MLNAIQCCIYSKCSAHLTTDVGCAGEKGRATLEVERSPTLEVGRYTSVVGGADIGERVQWGVVLQSPSEVQGELKSGKGTMYVCA